MHKEEFSLGYWDLLPIRVAAGGIIIGTIISFIRWYFDKTDNQSKNEKLKVVKNFLLKDYFLLILIFLWVIRGVSAINTPEIFESLALFSFFTSVVYLYIVFKYLIDKYGNQFYKTVFVLFLATGVFASVYALIQYYLRICCRKTIGGVWVIPGFTPRLGATFWDVNHFGGFLIALIPLSIALIFASKRSTHKIYAVIMTVLFMGMLFMTQSRSSWIGLAFGLLITILIYFGAKLKKPLILGGIALVLGITMFFGYATYKEISIKSKIASYMHYRLDSTDTHIMLLEGASQIFFDNLVFGAGYGNFDEAFRQTETAKNYFDREPKLREMKVPPHSIWGENLAETGALGIVAYGLLGVSLLGSLITAIFFTGNKRYKYLGIGLLGSVISLFVAGLFYSYNLEFYWMLVFLSIGYVYLVLNKNYSLQYVIKWWYKRPITPYLIIIPPTVFYLFIRLGTVSLIDWDEAIYGKVAKNIVESGNWLSLRWNDASKYWFEKPPFYMWLTALAYKVVGANALGARLFSAIFGLLGIVIVYQFGRKLYNKFVGITASLILLSTIHYLYYSRNGMLDVTVTFFITLAMFAFYSALNVKKDSKKIYYYYLIAGVAIGLGVMTKAVIGLLPVPVFAVYLLYLWLYKKQEPDKKGIFLMGISALLIALPWHAYSAVVYGKDFLDEYFIDHIIGRGLSGLGHEKPIWWFLEVIKVSLRIWVVPFVLGILALPFIDKKKRDEYIYLFIGIMFVLFFFSISKDKLQWYIMPIYPLIAILTARSIERIVVIINSLLRKEFTIDYTILRSVALFFIFLISVFYVVVMRERVYYPDANKDKIALLKIFNDTYPKEEYPDKRLFFNRAVTPTLVFYSDHELKSIGDADVLEIIEESAPDQSNDFLLTQDIYYEVRDHNSQIDAPVVLEVKGATGGWFLIKALSRVEYYRGEFARIASALGPLNSKVLLNIPLTPAEKIQLKELNDEYTKVVEKLTEYGYPPFTEKTE